VGRTITSCERGRNIIFVYFVASGQYIPPLVIYPRKNLKMDFHEDVSTHLLTLKMDRLTLDLFTALFEH